MPKRQSHVHRLKKYKYPSGNSIFFCTLPDCHFKIDAPLALGKRALCNVCGAEFIMNEYSLKLVKPHCLDCGKIKVKDVDGNNRYVKKAANKILAGVGDETSQDLRSRLNSVVSDSVEEDI